MAIEKRVPTYLECFLQRRQNFGMRTSQGMVFGKTRELEDVPNIIFSRYDPIPAASLATKMDAGVTTFTDYHKWDWQNEQGDDIFYEWDSDKIIQAFIGITPAPARLFRRIPTPIPRGNLSRIKISSYTVDTIGFIDGHEAGSPYDMPTVHSEMLIPKEFFVDFAVFNPLAVPITPTFKIVARRFQVKWYDYANKIDREVIKSMWLGKIPWKPWSPGIESMDYDIQGKLNIAPVPITQLDEDTGIASPKGA